MARFFDIFPRLNRSQFDKDLNKLENEKVNIDVNVNGQNSAKNTNKALSDLNNTGRDSSKVFSDLRLKMGAYLTTVKAVTEAVKGSISTIKMYDDYTTDLANAMGGSREEAEQYLITLSQQGKELKATVGEMAEGADSLIRSGKSVSETETLLKDSLILSKVAKMDSADATDTLLTVMNSYQKGTEEVIDTVDALCAVDMTSAASADGLAISLGKSASAANMAGVEINKLIAMLAVMKEAAPTESDEAIGNSMKSILSRLNQVKAGVYVDSETEESLNDVEKVLKKVGISVRNVNGDFIESEKIIDEVGQKWSSFDSVTKRAVAAVMGGSYQYNRVISLFEGYSKVLEYTEIAQNSSGKSLEKFGNYEESIEAKTKLLQNRLESLAYDTFGNAFYGNVLDATTGLVQFAEKTEAVKIGLTGLGVVGGAKLFTNISTAIVGTTKNLSNFYTAMQIAKSADIATDNFDILLKLSNGLSDSQVKLVLSSKTLEDQQRINILIARGMSEQEARTALMTYGLATAEDKATVSTVSLSGAVKGLGLSIKGLVTAHPVLAVIASIGAVTFGVIKAVDAFTVSTEEHEERLEELKQEYSEIKSELENLNSEFDTTKSKIEELEGKGGKLSFTEEKELDRLREQNNELQRTIDLLKLEEQQKAKETNKEFIDTMDSDVDTSEKRVFTGNLTSRDMAETKLITEDEYIVQQFEELKRLQDELSNPELNQIQKDNLNKQIDNIEKYLRDKNNDFTTRMDGIEYIEEPTSEDEERVNAWLDYINDFQDRMAIALSGENAEINAFNRIVDNWQFDDLTQELQKLGKEGKVTADMLNDPKYDEFIKKLVYLGVVDSADNLNDIALAFNNIAKSSELTLPDSYEAEFDFKFEGLEDLESELSSIQDAYDTVIGAMDEYNNQGFLSMDTIDSLIALDDAYINKLIDENGQLQYNSEAFRELATVKIEEAKAAIYQEACNELVRIKQLDTALAANELALANGTLTESAYETARALYEEVIAMGGANAALGQNVWDATEKKVALLDEQLKNVTNSTYDFKKASASKSSSSSTDPIKEAFEAEYNLLKHKLAIELITEEEYYHAVNALNQKYYAGKAEYLDEYRKYVEEVYKGLKQVQDDYLSDAKAEISHYENLDKYVGNEVSHVEELRNAYETYADDQEERWEAEEEMYKLREEYLERWLSLTKEIYNEPLDLIGSYKDELQSYMDVIESEDGVIGESIYNALIDATKMEIDTYQQKRAEIAKQLQNGLAKGLIEEGDTNWYELQQQINECDRAILDSTVSLNEFQDALIELDWSKFDELAEKIENVNTQLDELQNLFSEKDMFNDDGTLTNEGLTYTAMVLQERENSMYKLKEIQEELNDLEGQYGAGLISQNEYVERYNELLDMQWDALQSQLDAENALIDLKKQEYQEQIDALQEAADEEDRLYQLEKARYELERAKNQKNKLFFNGSEYVFTQDEDAIREAEDNLRKLELEDTINGLQELIDELEEGTIDIGELLTNTIDLVNQNASTVYETLMDYSVKYGITIDDNVIDPWNGATNALTQFGKKVTDTSSACTIQLSKVKKEINNIRTEANKTAQSIVNMLNPDFENIKISLADVVGRISLINSAAEGAYAAMQALNYMDFSNVYSAIDGLIDKLNSIPTDIKVNVSTTGDISGGSTVEDKSNPYWIYKTVKGGYSSNGEATSQVANYNGDGVIKIGNEYLIIKWLKGYLTNGEATSQINNYNGSGVYKRYAKGGKNLKEQLAWTQEYGSEAILSPTSNAILTPIRNDDSVLTKAMTDNLWDWAKLNPAQFDYKLPDTSYLTNVQPRTQTVNEQNYWNFGDLNLEGVNEVTDFIRGLKNLKNDAIQRANKRY